MKSGGQGRPPLQTSWYWKCLDFHTSNIQRARMKRLAQPIVRLGNPIGRPPEGRSLRNALSVNGTQKQNAFSGASARFRVPGASFLPILFWQDRKEWAAGGTTRHSGAEKIWPRSGGDGAHNRTAPSVHSKCPAGGIPHQLVQKRMRSLPLQKTE